MKPTPEQRVAIETQDRALIVEAGAGTGKTWVLVQRFMYLLETHPDWPLESTFAITFTEKAAREMRTRLRKAIEYRARENPQASHWQDHRLNLDRLQVSTIHSLCARILRENSIQAEIDPRFQVLDEQEADLLKEQAIRETIKALDEENHQALELLASLRIYDLRSEMESMLSKRGTLHQQFNDLYDPGTLLEKWKTGIEEMREGLWQGQLLEYPDLFIICEEILEISIPDPTDKLTPAVQAAKEGASAAGRGEYVEAVTQWLSIKRSGGRAVNWGGKDGKAHLSKELLEPLQVVAKKLEKKGFLQEIGPADQDASQHLQLWRALWERLEQTYRQIKETQQALDFDDLELLTDRLLHQTPRTHRLDGFLSSMNHLMVDEFQDTNLVQQRIVYALAPIEDPGKLFVVGDAKQSIYRFRQAQVSIFSHTSADIQAITNKPAEKLSTSFRTHQSLLKATNHLFDQLLQPMGEAHADFEAPPGPLRAHREAHPELASQVEMLFLPAKDHHDQNISAEDARVWEAQWIAQRILQLKDACFLIWEKNKETYRPFEFRDAAVLFRATTNLPLYEAEFKNAGLPYLTVSGRGFYDRLEVQDLIALLAALANPLDDLNLAASLRSPLFSLNDETLFKLRWHTPDGEIAQKPIPLRKAVSHSPNTDQGELVARASKIIEELWALAGRVEVWSLLREALDKTSYETTLAQNDGDTGRQLENVKKFLSLARERSGVSIASFLHRIRDLKAREAREGEALGREPESGAVQLMSIHASKGLEFPVVVVADLGRKKGGGFGTPYLLHDPAFGLVCKVRDEYGDWQKPASYAWGEWLHNRMEEAERKRLFYVACTRAADLLILSGQLANKDSWLMETLEAWGVEEDGSEEETHYCDNFAIHVYRPQAPEEIKQTVSEIERKEIGIKAIPPLVEPLPPRVQPQSVSVTRLEQLLSIEGDNLSKIQPALWASQRAEKSANAPGYLIGNIVHQALAHWDCLSYSDSELFHFLENYARREGVFPDALAHAVRTSHGMMINLRTHPIYETVQQAAEKYREIPFTLTSPLGILHGVIDLLFQDTQGKWHLLDWKTEWSPRELIEENAQQHLIQMATYAQATKSRLDVIPDVALCFLFPKVAVHRFTEDDIERAWLEINGQY